MLRYLIFSLLLIVLFLGSCQEEKYKTPGAFEALQMMNSMRAYPNNDIPADGFYKGFEHHQKLKSNNESKSLADPWEAKGPLNTTGRTLTLEVNPQAPNTLYAGSASGGLWRSRNLGLGVSWEYVETGFPVLGVSDIEFIPGDSTTMFIGTGELYNYYFTGTDGAFRATRGSYGIGILKSVDGGESWTKSLDWTYENQHGVWMIKVAPSDHDVIYTATSEGVFKSTDQGDSWAKKLDVIMATDIVVHPDDANQVIASCGNFGTPNRGIYKSVDGGETWNHITQNFPMSFQGKILMDHAKSNPQVVYASVGNGFGGGDEASWLLRSEDFGSTWEVVNNVDYSKWQGWFAHDVAVDPDDPNQISIIGIDIWRSWDGGRTLSQVSNGGVTFGRPDIGGPDGPPDYSHSDHHFVSYHPTIDDLILYANDGGVFLSFDEGSTFQSANGGMQTTQFYNGFSVSQVSSDHAMGGLQDNSTSIYKGDGRWLRAIGGDGSWTATNSQNPLEIYGSWQNLNIRKSINGGSSFQSIGPPKLGDERPLFIAPFAIAPSEPSTIYAAGKYVYKSTDAGDSFIVANLGQLLDGNPAYAVDVSATNPDVVYVVTAPNFSSGDNFPPGVAVSTNGGNMFESRSLDLPNRVPNDVTVDPNDPAVAYITISGFGTNHLFRTEDYGENWTAIDNGLPDVPGNALAVDPSDSNQLYYGNDIGVYFSPDYGNTWTVWGEGMPMASIVMDLKISTFDRSIWVATHGNGTYKRFLEPSPVSVKDEQLAQVDYKVYPNPTSDQIFVEIENSAVNEHIMQIFDLKGQLVIKQELNLGKNSIDLTQLTKGTYSMVIENGSDYYQKVIIKQRE